MPVFCLGEFLRVVTHPRLFAEPFSPEEACRALGLLMEAPGMEVLFPAEQYPQFLADAVSEIGARGNLVFDAQIVALCREAGVDRILTEDGDFSRFRGITVERL